MPGKTTKYVSRSPSTGRAWRVAHLPRQVTDPDLSLVVGEAKRQAIAQAWAGIASDFIGPRTHAAMDKALRDAGILKD